MFKVLMMCAALIAAGVCYSGEDESVVGPLDVIEIGEDNVCGMRFLLCLDVFVS